jgi:hypothetical protein
MVRTPETTMATKTSTLRDHAQHFVNAVGGRFTLEMPPIVEMGKGTPSYPRIESGPWASGDPTGTEPPLGYRIDALPDMTTLDGSPIQGEASAPADVPVESPAAIDTLSVISDLIAKTDRLATIVEEETGEEATELRGMEGELRAITGFVTEASTALRSQLDAKLAEVLQRYNVAAVLDPASALSPVESAPATDSKEG